MTGPPPGVELWLVDLRRVGPALAALEKATPRLSDDERQRARQLSASGEDWRLIRVALRLLLERFVGPKLRGLQFSHSSRGKPALPWSAGIEFSLAHSGQFALIAIAPADVGVDIEQDRNVRFSPNRQKAMLAAARALVPASPDRHIEEDPPPIQAWVRLEAWGKARGSGIGALLQDLGIRGPDWKSAGSNIDFGRRAAELLKDEGFVLQDVPLPPPLFGAVAVRRGTAILPVRHLPAEPAAIMELLPAT